MFESTEDRIQKDTIESRFHDASKYPLINKINFVIYQYEEQEKGTNIRLNHKRNEMYLSILIFCLISIAESFFLSLKSEYSIFYPGVWGIWIAFIVVGIAVIKSGIWMIEKIFEFNVNNETLAFMKYKAKRGIFTLKAEQRYCREQISNLKDVIMKIETGLDEDIVNEYKNVAYIERRADHKVFSFFENHKIICNIVIIIVIMFQLVNCK